MKKGKEKRGHEETGSQKQRGPPGSSDPRKVTSGPLKEPQEGGDWRGRGGGTYPPPWCSIMFNSVTSYRGNGASALWSR